MKVNKKYILQEDLEQNNELEDETTHDVDKNTPQYKGTVLMKRALELLEQGNFEGFESNRKLANEMFDEMTEDNDELDTLYNESRNFGIIYNVIEANVPKLMENNDGINSLKKIVKLIKSNKLLHEQFKAYNNLQPNNKIVNITEYINEAISLIPNFDKKVIKEENTKLIQVMKDAKLNEMVEIKDEMLDLYEAIEFVTLNKKNLNNIDEYIQAVNVIKEANEKLPSKVSDEHTISDYSDNVNQWSDGMSEELNADELDLIKEFSVGDKEKLFSEQKKKTIKTITNVMSEEKDIETKARLSQILEKVNQKQYTNDKTSLVDISEMMEIQETLEN